MLKLIKLFYNYILKIIYFINFLLIFFYLINILFIIKLLENCKKKIFFIIFKFLFLFISNNKRSK